MALFFQPATITSVGASPPFAFGTGCGDIPLPIAVSPPSVPEVVSNFAFDEVIAKQFGAQHPLRKCL
jgi:hypothetical protein